MKKLFIIIAIICFALQVCAQEFKIQCNCKYGLRIRYDVKSNTVLYKDPSIVNKPTGPLVFYIDNKTKTIYDDEHQKLYTSTFNSEKIVIVEYSNASCGKIIGSGKEIVLNRVNKTIKGNVFFIYNIDGNIFKDITSFQGKYN